MSMSFFVIDLTITRQWRKLAELSIGLLEEGTLIIGELVNGMQLILLKLI